MLGEALAEKGGASIGGMHSAGIALITVGRAAFRVLGSLTVLSLSWATGAYRKALA